MPAAISASSGAVVGSTTVSIGNLDPTLSCRLGDSWLESYWELSLGSPETTGLLHYQQSAGTTSLVLDARGPGAGFNIDPTATFTLASPQNVDQTIESSPSASADSWEVDGVVYEATEDHNQRS